MSDSVSNYSNHNEQKDISLVPWFNAGQFRKVYENLYSSDLSKKRWAVDQISVWETRCHPSLPTAVEASLVISRAIIQDVLLTNGASLCQERDIQMMYAMALVRFVNLTIETHQKCQSNVATTAQIAKGLGIPSWIVDLRNEATHSFWPSVPSLRLAAESAMKYLNESFWEKEASTLKDFEKEPFNETGIRTLIKEYMRLQYAILSMKKKQPEDGRISKDFHNVHDKLTFCFQKNKRQCINILISDGLFIPTDAELRKLMPYREHIRYQEMYDENYTRPKSVPPVPVELEDLWKPLLNTLHMLQAIPLLLEALLKSQADRNELGKKLVISWVLKILRIQMGESFEETSLRKTFHKKGMVVNWHSMMYAALSRPCLYTPFVFPLIFSHLQVKDSVTRYILHLLAIALGQSNWRSVQLTSGYSLKSVEDVKQMRLLQDAKRKNKTRISDECIWSVAQDTFYVSWPIGFISNAVDDDDDEDDDDDDDEEEEIIDEQFEDFVPIEEFDEKMDNREGYFLGNENDNEEKVSESVEPNISEDEMDLSERETFLYRKK